MSTRFHLTRLSWSVRPVVGDQSCPTGWINPPNPSYPEHLGDPTHRDGGQADPAEAGPHRVHLPEGAGPLQARGGGVEAGSAGGSASRPNPPDAPGLFCLPIKYPMHWNLQLSLSNIILVVSIQLIPFVFVHLSNNYSLCLLWIILLLFLFVVFLKYLFSLSLFFVLF